MHTPTRSRPAARPRWVGTAPLVAVTLVVTPVVTGVSLAGAAGRGGVLVAAVAGGPQSGNVPAQSSSSASPRGAPPRSSGSPSRADPVAVTTSDGVSSGRWAWPLQPRPAVLRRFEAPAGPYAAGHRGVDLASRPGQQVLSPTAGTVTFSGSVAGQPVVVVTHPGGRRSTFQPVTGTVPVGTAVARGDPVGVVGVAAGHCAPPSCLHWGVLRGPVYLDPLRFVLGGPVVLLPLPPG